MYAYAITRNARGAYYVEYVLSVWERVQPRVSTSSIEYVRVKLASSRSLTKLYLPPGQWF